MVQRRERLIQFLKMLGQRALRIDIERRAEFFSERFNAHIFTKQPFTDIAKIMHKGSF